MDGYIDRVLRDLDILQKNLNKSNSYNPIFSDTIRRMKFLKTFIKSEISCRQKYDRLLPNIDDTVKKFGEDIHILSVRSESESFSNLIGVSDQLVFDFKRRIGGSHEGIVRAYEQSISFGWSFATFYEIVEFIDLVLQNLVDLHLVRKKSYCAALRAQIQDLEEKLTFLKSFVCFAKLGGSNHHDFIRWLDHIVAIALKAASLSYMCSFLDEVGEGHSFVCKDVEKCPFHDEIESEYIGKFCSMICKQIEEIKPVDLQGGEIYIDILKASKSSASSRTMKMDEHILNNFNDSLISFIWKLLCCNSNFMDFRKDELEILFSELRFLRSILRMPMEKKNELNEKIGGGWRFLRCILRKPKEEKKELNERIGALLREAGIIICTLALSRVKGGDVNSLDTKKARHCSHMLVNINKRIKHITDLASVSSRGCLAPCHSFKIQKCYKPFSYKLSKAMKSQALRDLASVSSRGCLASCRSFKIQKCYKPFSYKLSKMLPALQVPMTHEVTVGHDDEAKKVSDRLIGGPEQLEIVPIVGMAGLGKTTLAKRVYNDNSIIYSFHIRLWCTISQVYNMKDLLLQILCSDGKRPGINEELEILDEHDLLHKLYQKLKGKRYLVVFDDVWDFSIWNDVRCSFPDEMRSSRILITSRFSNVASQVECGGEPLDLRLLTDIESLQLLQKKVFGEEDCPQSLHGPSVEIAKFCKGLPLAIVAVAGIVATLDLEHDVSAWEEFAKSLTSTVVSLTETCKKSLELSYENLPHHLKPCLLYFAAFGEDAKIVTRNLIRLWVAEGFVENTDGKKLEDVAEEYMMDLIGRNLVMVSERSSMGGVKASCIHDLLLEFCKSKAKETDFLRVLRGYDELYTFNEPRYPPRLSICSSAEDFHKSKLFCPQLGSLLFFRQNAGDDFPLADVSFLFCIYKHLTVLNLEHVVLIHKELPTEVESLCRLRYLALRADALRFVPLSISNLSSLETFYLQSLVEVSLPYTIWDMKKLRHVRVGGRLGARVLPSDNVLENSSTLPGLDTLCYLRLPFNQEGEAMLRRIPNIRQLKIVTADVGEEVCCNMSQLDTLESLNIVSSHFQGPRNHFELSFPKNLKKLLLSGLNLPWSKISLIEQLPNLEVLKLLCDSLRGRRWELTEGGFPKLRVLTLSDVNVVEWTETDTDSDDYFPCLEELKLVGELKLERVPSCLERISTLEMIKVYICGKSDYVGSVISLVRGIEEAQENYGNQNLKILVDCQAW
ncbi:putative late blight resistance protein homolog R1B-8 [Coffea eugenioides]|uniref:putative late blight resistance protein homolog R1B-8 n=1 Tax=Coffea eugenioides TaxID=49369 RepID=UPI000F6076DD|nr:putative late blight resistance protein homolog R1B-8 [Coffea eugenioides]